MFLCMEFLYLIFEKDFSLKIIIFELRNSIWIWTIKNDFFMVTFFKIRFFSSIWYLIQELFTNFLFKNSCIYFIFVISFQIYCLKQRIFVWSWYLKGLFLAISTFRCLRIFAVLDKTNDLIKDFFLEIAVF